MTRTPTMTRRNLSATLLLVIILEFGCGAGTALKSFRLALASSGPLVNSLVAAGAIPSARAQAVITDFNDGAGCGLALQTDFAAIPKDATEQEKTSLKLNASVKALKCFRLIVDRQNFAVNPKVQSVANIAEGILASLVVFYSEPGEIRASAESRATVTVRNEAELEAALKAQVETLRKAMKP